MEPAGEVCLRRGVDYAPDRGPILYFAPVVKRRSGWSGFAWEQRTEEHGFSFVILGDTAIRLAVQSVGFGRKQFVAKPQIKPQIRKCI